MSTVPHKKTSLADLFAPKSKVAGGDTQWENVMVQITLAFVIILGYLISMGINESRNLAAETAMQRKENQLLAKIVKDFSGTEAGKERAKRIVAQQQVQLQRLLNRWYRMREDREFYRLLKQYHDAEWVVLADDLQSLPAASSFSRFNEEIDRIFPDGEETVARAEVQRLLDGVLTAEGFDLNALTELPPGIAPEAEPQLDDPTTPTQKNVDMLRLQIKGDLAAERKDLMEIQYALVEKIAAARTVKLAALPLGAEGDAAIDLDAPNLGKVMLEHILADLHKDMRLLTETAARIRGENDPTPAPDAN
jgi:hypothetical protein